jgi:uncharacterized protein involved in outer membrane biogenesis
MFVRSRSMRSRIGWWAAAILAPLAAIVVLAPYVVDVEAYKPALVEAVKDATGRELVIDGPMKLSLLPVPRISASQVHFSNAPGAEGAQMMDVRWVGISPSLWALLRGEIQVGRLTLYQPNIVLETDADGVPNWHFEPGAGAKQPQGAPAAGLHLAAGQLRIVQGTVTYTNPQTKQVLKAGQVDATASVSSLKGPLSIAGSATVNGVPLSLDFSLGGPGRDGHETALNLSLSSGQLVFKGTVSDVSADADVKGQLAVSTGLLTDFITTLMQATGHAMPKFDAPVVGIFTFDGGFELSRERLAITDFRMSLGGETASGTLALAAAKAPSITGHVRLQRVDLEKWLALLATPGAFQGSAAKPGSFWPLPAGTDVSLALDIAQLVYRREAVCDFALALEIHKGVVAVPELKAILPGDLVLQAHASTDATAGGEISLAGPGLRDTLMWLGIDTSDVPADRLQKVELSGKLAATANGLQVAGLVLDVDRQRATGSGAVSFATPLALSATLQLDRFDLDAYLPVDQASAADAMPSATDKPSAASTAVPPASSPPDKTLPDKTLPVFGLKAKVAKLVFRGQPLTGVESDLSVQGNLLKLNSVKVADLLGAKLGVQGSIADVGAAPRYDLTFNASMPDADKVIAYVGLPTFANGKIGAVSSSGSVAGTLEAVSLRNTTVSLLDSTAQATGTLALGKNFRFDFPSFTLETPDASRLLAAATGRAQSGVGALSANGAFKGDGQRASFDGNLSAVGTAMAGHVEATLGKRPNITANLRIPGTLDFDHWLGVSADARTAPAAAAAADSAPLPVASPHAATGKSIDLSALRAFDASLTLETSAITIASLRVAYADLQASLQNGLLKLAKLTGQFYGGAVDFNGTVDAAGAALALDLRGSLQGIYVGEMLRGAAGTNSFGNQNLMVSIDGKLNVMNIALQGNGMSPEQIRNGLNGRGQVSGYVYPSVVGGSLSLASLGANIASIFSTQMGFNASVLSAFINHQNALAGELLLSDGTVILQNQTLQGQSAVASITSRTILATGVTDTTIALDTSSRGPPSYIMTVKGPVSSPTMTTRSGPAN